MIRPEKIQNFYETHLITKLESLEEQRQAIVQKIKFLIGGYIVLMVALIVMLFVLLEAWFLSVIGMILVTIGVIYFYNKWGYPYKTRFKTEIVSRIVTFIDDSLSYFPEKKITLYEFTASRLQEYWLLPRVRRSSFFNNWNWESDQRHHSVHQNWDIDGWRDQSWESDRRRYSIWQLDRWDGNVIYRSGEIDRWTGEDYVEGMLGTTAVKFSEVHAEYKEISEYCCDEEGYMETSIRYYSIFEGLFFIFELNQDVNGFTIVLPKNNKITRSIGTVVRLGYSEFDREFVVYSDNPIMARQILSPSLIRRILTFHRQLGNAVCLSIFKGQLYLGITSRQDLFEAPSIFKSLLEDFEYVYEYLEYMYFAKDLVEELNLNTPLGNNGTGNLQQTTPAVLSNDNLTKMIREKQ